MDSSSLANLSLKDGQGNPSGASFIDSPVAKQRKTRPGYIQLNVEKAWATRAGWYLSRGGVTVPMDTVFVLSATEASQTQAKPE